jgi:regulatory protein
MEKEQVLAYLQNLCVKRECCSSEILKKAEKALEGDRGAAQQMLESLVADRFVDDARYAAAFAREKSSLTGWGPNKIRYALMMKGISKADVAAALEETDPEASSAKLEKLVEAKRRSLEGDPYIKFKLIKYALSRGYEYDVVAPVVERVLGQ